MKALLIGSTGATGYDLLGHLKKMAPVTTEAVARDMIEAAQKSLP